PEGCPRRLPQDAQRHQVHHRPEVLRPVPVTRPRCQSGKPDLPTSNLQGSITMRRVKVWLASGLAAALVLAAGGGAQPRGRGGGAPPDKKEGRPRGFEGPGGGGPRGFAGPGGPSAERALAELKLSDKTKEKAEAIVKANQEDTRRLLDLARS